MSGRSRSCFGGEERIQAPEFFYFHNCVRLTCGATATGAATEKFDTWDVIRKYQRDYKLVFVGDATMSPYEIPQGRMAASSTTTRARRRVAAAPDRCLPALRLDQPGPQGVWQYRQSVDIIRQLMGNHVAAR